MPFLVSILFYTLYESTLESSRDSTGSSDMTRRAAESLLRRNFLAAIAQTRRLVSHLAAELKPRQAAGPVRLVCPGPTVLS